MLSTQSTAVSSLANSPAAKLPTALSLQGAKPGTDTAVQDARELKEAYQQFVGETFFGQLMKSMRQTVGEPAYLHGGMAEEQFQARLDQQIAQDMAATGSNGLADELFASQFPEQAKLLADQPSEGNAGTSNLLRGLDTLRRR